MTSTAFLLLNLTLAFYNVGTIWANEIGELIAQDRQRSLLWRPQHFWWKHGQPLAKIESSEGR